MVGRENRIEQGITAGVFQQFDIHQNPVFVKEHSEENQSDGEDKLCGDPLVSEQFPFRKNNQHYSGQKTTDATPPDNAPSDFAPPIILTERWQVFTKKTLAQNASNIKRLPWNLPCLRIRFFAEELASRAAIVQ